MGNVLSLQPGVLGSRPDTNRVLFLILLLHRYWHGVLAANATSSTPCNKDGGGAPGETPQDAPRVLVVEEEFSVMGSQRSLCGCSWCDDPDTRCHYTVSEVVAEGPAMSPNSEEDGPIRLKAPGPGDGLWAHEDPNKDLQRPPIYNPEDYALSLRKWGRRQNAAPQLYGGGTGDQEGCSKTLPPPSTNLKTPPSPNVRHQQEPAPAPPPVRDYRHPGLTPTPPGGEMSLRQFSTVSELLAKLKTDLKQAFPSFVQEFVGDPLDGVTLLLELLRAVQLSQAAQQARCPPPLLRRVLLDEHSCLQCLKSCLRCPDAARRLSSSPAGLFTLAVCIMSNVSKSRVVALELLTRACEPPGCGHTPVSEALSTLRLRFGEPVRFRFLVGMLISAGGCPELQAAGLRFLNTFLDTAPSQQHRLYLQAELEQAGFTTAAIRKILPSNQIAAQQVVAELDRWERSYVDLAVISERLEEAESMTRAARDKTQLLERRVQILQEEKSILLSLEQVLKERCCELEKEVTSLRQGSFKRQGSSSNKQGGSTPAEDEGISSSDQDHSLTSDDVEREPMVYEMFAVRNDTILVDSNRVSAVMTETSVDDEEDNNNNMKIIGVHDDEEDDEETTIDEVIEELRNIINDAETEAYAAEAAENAKRRQKELEERRDEEKRKTRKLEIEEERMRAQQKSGGDSNVRRISVEYHREDHYINVEVPDDPEIIPGRLLPQPPRRTRSLSHLACRDYADDSVIPSGRSPFFEDFDDGTSLRSTEEGEEDSDSLLSASRERDKKRDAAGGRLSDSFAPKENKHYEKIFTYNVSTAKSCVRSDQYFDDEPPQDLEINRSKSFHLISQDNPEAEEELCKREERLLQDVVEKSRRTLTGQKRGSLEGLFHGVDSTPPIQADRPQPGNPPSTVKEGEDRASQLLLPGKRLKSKSLDRIDEGLDSMVDIVLTSDPCKSRHSSGRGSASEEWSLEWDRSYLDARRSLAEAALAYSTPPPVVIVSLSPSSNQPQTKEILYTQPLKRGADTEPTKQKAQPQTPIQRDYLSTHFPRNPVENSPTLNQNTNFPVRTNGEFATNKLANFPRSPNGSWNPSNHFPRSPNSSTAQSGQFSSCSPNSSVNQNCKRYPPDGSSHPLFLPTRGVSSGMPFEASPHRKNSPTNSVNNKTFLIKRGHTNAGLYSGHAVPGQKRSTPPVSEHGPLGRSRVTVVPPGKVTDLPSGLY